MLPRMAVTLILIICICGCKDVSNNGSPKDIAGCVEELSNKWQVPLEYVDFLDRATGVKLKYPLKGKSFFEDFFNLNDLLMEEYDLSLGWNREIDKAIMVPNKESKDRIVSKRFSNNYALVVTDRNVDVDKKFYPVNLYYLPGVYISNAEFYPDVENETNIHPKPLLGIPKLELGYISRTDASNLSGKVHLQIIDKWKHVPLSLDLNKKTKVDVGANRYEVELLEVEHIGDYQLVGLSVAAEAFKVSENADLTTSVTSLTIKVSGNAFPWLWTLEDMKLESGGKIFKPYEFNISSKGESFCEVEMVFPRVKDEFVLKLKFPAAFSKRMIKFR